MVQGYADKRLYGPRIFGAGLALRITGGHGAEGRVDTVHLQSYLEVDGPDAVAQAVRYVLKMGADWVKIDDHRRHRGRARGHGRIADDL